MSAEPVTTPDQARDRELGELTRGWAREALLGSMAADQREIDAAEARKLQRVTVWADLHRTDVVESHAGEDLLGGHDQHSMPILMSGVPVAEYCLAELSAALRTGHGAVRALTEQALEGRERLPRLWARCQAGHLPAWKLRLVAKETLSLSDEAADYVDRHLAPFAKHLSVGRIKNPITTAILRHDP